jgi:hypothetical protein
MRVASIREAVVVDLAIQSHHGQKASTTITLVSNPRTPDSIPRRGSGAHCSIGSDTVPWGLVDSSDESAMDLQIRKH